MPYPIPYIAIIDVGHGNCTILRDGDETIVIDCGAKSSGLIEFLVKENINVIQNGESLVLNPEQIAEVFGMIRQRG